MLMIENLILLVKTKRFFFLRNMCHTHDLVDLSHLSGGLRMRFSDAAGDIQKPIISIDSLADATGRTINVKAICHRHKNCTCWVRSKASQNSRLQILERLVSWGALGRMQSASDHAASAAEIKVVDFGMRVRFMC